ncbi:MAG TPA: response regulator [Thermoanaerobaculia bacterium]|nr:response regulator [Thermoanaerobaculia bacterium]
MTHNSRVLLVDADEQVRALLARALLDRDVFCDAAVSARDALAQLGQRRYTLMLLHLEMDGVDGILDCIRSMAASHRPMVLMTADVRTPKDAIDTDFVQIIIRRPLKIAEVAGMIRACLEFVPDGSSGLVD